METLELRPGWADRADERPERPEAAVLSRVVGPPSVRPSSSWVSAVWAERRASPRDRACHGRRSKADSPATGAPAREVRSDCRHADKARQHPPETTLMPARRLPSSTAPRGPATRGTAQTPGEHPASSTRTYNGNDRLTSVRGDRGPPTVSP